MCGILCMLNSSATGLTGEKLLNYARQELKKGECRGPEKSTLIIRDNIIFGFHRLAINGLNSKSNQPFNINNITLVCNGEIYNYKELAHTNNINLTTDSDCEIILHLYLLYGI